MTKNNYLQKAVKWAEKNANASLKSISEGYEDPQIFTSKETQEEFQADISFVTHGGVKHYSVVALKDQDLKKTVTKWKVLSFMASMKKGQLHLLAPNGHKAFAEKLIEKHHINAVIHAL